MSNTFNTRHAYGRRQRMRLLGLFGFALLGCSGGQFGSAVVEAAGGDAADPGTTSGGSAVVTARGGSSAGSGTVVKNQDPDVGNGGEGGMESGGSGGALHGGSAGTTAGSGGSTPSISGSSSGGSGGQQVGGSAGSSVGGSAGTGLTGPVGDVCDVPPETKLYDCSASTPCKKDFCGSLSDPGVQLNPGGTDRIDYSVVLDAAAPIPQAWCNDSPTFRYSMFQSSPNVCVRATAQPGSGMRFARTQCGEYVSDCVVITGSSTEVHVTQPIATSWLRLEVAGLVDGTHAVPCPFTCEGK